MLVQISDQPWLFQCDTVHTQLHGNPALSAGVGAVQGRPSKPQLPPLQLSRLPPQRQVPPAVRHPLKQSTVSSQLPSTVYTEDTEASEVTTSSLGAPSEKGRGRPGTTAADVDAPLIAFTPLPAAQ